MHRITEATFTESIKRLAGTDDGRIVLAWLKEYCFHEGSPLERGNLENTYANAAVQNVYRALRAFIGRDDLRKIEFDYKVEKEKPNVRRIASDGASPAD